MITIIREIEVCKEKKDERFEDYLDFFDFFIVVVYRSFEFLVIQEDSKKRNIYRKVLDVSYASTNTMKFNKML